ncbi:translation initiation factor IF-2 [Trichonephila clavata]|uniref:Translation initiation factor IF-2, chloroplastic n=1 Tax=Trichonephila clavata TaxID=2740835 RepID=A0A8X6KME8_TRICU|nr:translation initiation factor IF-2 [Trichonephila clavata]
MIANRKSSVKQKSNKNNIVGSLDVIKTAGELSLQKGLDFNVVIKALESAIEAVAYQKYGSKSKIVVNIDRNTGKVTSYRKLKVIDDESDGEKNTEYESITLTQAKLIKEDAKVGDTVSELLSLNTDLASARIAQQKIAQIIKDEESKKQYEEFKDKVGEIRYGIVKQVEYSDLIIDINGTRAYLPLRNLTGGESFREGDKVKTYIQTVKRSDYGRQIILSRTHEGFLDALLNQEIPEIADGLVTIKGIARDAGSRSKVAVFSPDKNIDPVGACVGVKGDRIKTIIHELNGEKIDVINYSSDLGQFVIKAITPAEVSKVIIDENENCIELIVAEDQLSLAIGKKGQNVRLASELVGWKIEILSTQQESERRSKELSQCSALFAEALNLEEIMGQLLVTEGFSSVEDISNASIKELASIEGFNEDIANELHNRANKYLKAENDRKIEELKSLGMEDDVINLTLSIDNKIALSKHDIKTLEDIADLSSYEFCSILSSSADSKENLKDTVDSIIIEAPSPSTGATIVKKRRKKSHDAEEHNLFDESKLGSLTEKEQIFRINAVQNAALLKERNQREEKEKTAKEESNKEIDEKNEADTLSKEISKKVLSNTHLVELREDNIDYESDDKKSSKVNKDIYSKHSKLVIAQAIDEKTEQPPVFKQRFGIRSRKSKFTKGKNISREVIIPDKITIRELSIRMAEDSKSVLKMFKEEVGESYRVDDLVDPDIASEIVEKFNHTAKRVSDTNREKDLFFIEGRESLPKKPKPPIVTFMGHVDHGKTSLLDAFRESNVAERESGGITQHIGAYQITTKDKQKITFIDTPGHEAFTAMRACGANITNIVVIVVAADDGIMKQTVEAINHAKAANVSIIVAINKIDKSEPGDVEKIINSLPQYDLISEELGGDIMIVPVSAKKKTNLDKLEEAILLIAELMKLEAIEDCRALGWVIESKIDKAKGISATLIVEEGTLKVGDILVVGTTYSKVRSMVNHLGQREKAALPSAPIEITGLNGVPNAGDKFVVVNSEKQAREIVEYRLELIKKKKEDLGDNNLDIFSRNNSETEELSVVLKCDVTGSIEAISSSIDKLGKDQVKLNILHKAVGGITDSDVLLAEASSAVILAFNVKVDSKIRDLAKQKGVEIHTYNIIYELIDDMRMYLTKMLKPVTREVRVGSASVKQIFNVSKAGNIIGCYVSDGVIRKDSLIKVVRGGKLVHEGKLKALRRFKDDVKEVGVNFECGVSLEGNIDIKVGDILEAYQLVQEERVL